MDACCSSIGHAPAVTAREQEYYVVYCGTHWHARRAGRPGLGPLLAQDRRAVYRRWIGWESRITIPWIFLWELLCACASAIRCVVCMHRRMACHALPRNKGACSRLYPHCACSSCMRPSPSRRPHAKAEAEVLLRALVVTDGRARGRPARSSGVRSGQRANVRRQAPNRNQARWAGARDTGKRPTVWGEVQRAACPAFRLRAVAVGGPIGRQSAPPPSRPQPDLGSRSE